jgi:tRNA(adenine34) deaminase
MTKKEIFSDEYWMHLALEEAYKAFTEDEVPVGAVVVKDDRVIGLGHNLTERLHDPTAHAEIIAITSAANFLNNWRLSDTIIYVTLEPCIMCIGALILARIKKLVFGAFDLKFGACGSIYNIPQDNKLNHRFEVVSGVLSQESQKLLQEFFRKKRQKRKSK